MTFFTKQVPPICTELLKANYSTMSFKRQELLIQGYWENQSASEGSIGL